MWSKELQAQDTTEYSLPTHSNDRLLFMFLEIITDFHISFCCRNYVFLSNTNDLYMKWLVKRTIQWNQTFKKNKERSSHGKWKLL